MCKKSFRPALVYSARKQFENAAFTLKTFSVHTAAGEIKKATITRHFAFKIVGNSSRKLHHHRDDNVFKKTLFSKMFSFHTKNEKPAFLNSLGLKLERQTNITSIEYKLIPPYH